MEPYDKLPQKVLDIDPFQRAEPRAMINLVTPRMQQRMIEAYQATPELFGVDERSLWLELKRRKELPTATDNRIRIKFWHEYDVAYEHGRTINVEAVLARVCAPEYFFQSYLARPTKVAWLLCMPAAYENKMEEMLEFGLEQLRDILDSDHGGSEGNPKLNIKLMELKAKIVAMVDQRLKGGVIQRVEQKNMNLSIHTSDKQIAAQAMSGSMDQINQRLKYLEKKDIDAKAGVLEGSAATQPEPPVE